ncbi:hypothetical protein ACQ5SP_12795 [Rhodovulum sp. YNF3179]|uniref:hypothetical protein n=1 Tax=Rhodovulum sp. YNF3179 TaxID=3425127 RepID=UPI003D329495
MSFENLKASVRLLMQEMVNRPDDAHILQEQLREKLAEMRDLGLPLPEDLVQLEKYLEDEEGEVPFDNVPL